MPRWGAETKRSTGQYIKGSCIRRILSGSSMTLYHTMSAASSLATMDHPSGGGPPQKPALKRHPKIGQWGLESLARKIVASGC